MGKRLVQKNLDTYLEKRDPKHYNEIVGKINEGVKSDPIHPLPKIQEVLESYFRGIPLTMRMVTYPKRDEYVGYDQETNTTVLCSCWDTSIPAGISSSEIKKVRVWFTAREGDLSKLNTDKIEKNPSRGFFYHVIKDIKYQVI